MPATPSPAQSEASRQNGAHSAGPATAAGKARSALNGVRHGLCGRTFFLLPDEDPAEFRKHEALWLAVWSPRDLHEHQAAEAAIRAMWRESRADRLEAQVLSDLFAAGELPDPAEGDAAKTAAFKALNSLLRYRGRIEREHRPPCRRSTTSANAAWPAPRAATERTRSHAAGGRRRRRRPTRRHGPHPAPPPMLPHLRAATSEPEPAPR